MKIGLAASLGTASEISDTPFNDAVVLTVTLVVLFLALLGTAGYFVHQTLAKKHCPNGFGLFGKNAVDEIEEEEERRSSFADAEDYMVQPGEATREMNKTIAATADGSQPHRSTANGKYLPSSK